MPSFFIPARDSRHRAACFALYRALLRQVPHISLPSEVTSRPGWTNPIRFLVRSGFRRNKSDTSPRLITSALKSGYRFLSLLARAHDTSSPQHREIVEFLHERQRRFPPSRNAPEEGKEGGKVKEGKGKGKNTTRRDRPADWVPLLTKVSGPGEEPRYTSNARPRPLSELSGGVRKVPVLDSTSNMSFLRIGKPQSHWHANFLRRKANVRQARITLFQELWEETRLSAAEEDQWEALLSDQAAEEGVAWEDESHNGGPQHIGPFERVVREHGVNYITNKLNNEVADTMAMANAMLDIVEQEKTLAEKEKRERREKKRRDWEEKIQEGKMRATIESLVPKRIHILK